MGKAFRLWNISIADYKSLRRDLAAIGERDGIFGRRKCVDVSGLCRAHVVPSALRDADARDDGSNTED